MGSGGYTFCEWKSVKGSWLGGGNENAEFKLWKKAFAEGEQKMISKCDVEWTPKTFGFLAPHDNQYGRTTILPEVFNDHLDVSMAHWRQAFTTAGHQTLIFGGNAGHTLPEEIKVLWLGLAFPNKEQHISEIKWQLGDRKYGRINLEELKIYEEPALIFEEAILMDEEQAFELYGYVVGPIPVDHEGNSRQFQRIVLLGALYYKIIDKVLGTVGANIT